MSQNNSMQFASSLPSVAGILSGVVIATAVPWVVLALGSNLGASTQTTVIVLALIIGGLVSLTSAFFGLVMPKNIPDHWTQPEHWQGWREWGKEAKGRASRGRQPQGEGRESRKS